MNVSYTKSLLQIFADSSDKDEREKTLSALLIQHAAPTINKIIRYKTRGAVDDGEEIYGEVMLQLVGRLQKLNGESNGATIEDFDSYVAVTTYNACDRFLSRKYPNRRRLKNGLRYLLTHRDGFAVWQNENGSYVGGFRGWQFGAAEFPDVKIRHLREDARAFERDVKVEKSWSDQKNAYELLTAIFNWTNSPVELDLLTNVCADWWNVTDETVAIDAPRTDDAGAANAPMQIDRRASQHLHRNRTARLSEPSVERNQRIADAPTPRRFA